MTDGTALGDRMKRYEEVSRTPLTPRMPLIVRIDGRAFHTYTRQFKKRADSPWSEDVRDGMTCAAQALLREIGGAKFAYLQSDEISVLVTDYDKLSSQPWFDKIGEKIASVSASIVTAEFNQRMLALEMGEIKVTVERTGVHVYKLEFPRLATFDSRPFVVPREDVCNYFVWRQRDAEKNSVAMLAQSQFSHRQLHGKDGSAMQDMLMRERGVNWNDLPTWQRRGWCVVRRTVTMTVRDLEARGGKVKKRTDVQIDPDTEVTRTAVEPDWDIPIFTKDRGYVEKFVDVGPEERER